MCYAEVYMEEEEYHPLAVSSSLFVDAIDEATAKMIVERLQASTASMAVAQLRVLGGAMARVPAAATAFAHRGRRIMVNVAAFYEGPKDKPVHQAWVDDFAAALRHDDTDVYVNFLSDEGAAAVRGAYPGQTWERLVAIKARYDPTNLFRLNQNIPPAPEETNGYSRSREWK
jgi:FAD/FMN-containing dehydrogenase